MIGKNKYFLQTKNTFEKCFYFLTKNITSVIFIFAKITDNFLSENHSLKYASKNILKVRKCRIY
jgi:hypothetical protein